ncbi:unnamed protein product [Rodentolepis nana]|uniref:DUF1771 domain-containing protein n=1 Tax=Rodentolepis nana TaxID=102285 RepID=A0A0R3TH59_RODNA|nr:unnamed protein product [Rodentolepis nana]
MSWSDSEEKVRFGAMVKERSKNKMLECMEEKDYEGFQYAKKHYEHANQYLDNLFTSEFNKVDAWQTNDDSSNDSS